MITENDCRIVVTVYPEDTDPSGHFASGDDEQDRQDVKRIIDDINNGNEWAWCMVRVDVYYGDMHEWDTLGACNYRNEADFRKDGYYSDMVEECVRRLNGEDYEEIDGILFAESEATDE